MEKQLLELISNYGVDETLTIVICIEMLTMLFGIKEEELRIETEVKMQRNLERIK